MVTLLYRNSLAFVYIQKKVSVRFLSPTPKIQEPVFESRQYILRENAMRFAESRSSP